jgi:hypothetical protein
MLQSGLDGEAIGKRNRMSSIFFDPQIGEKAGTVLL